MTDQTFDVNDKAQNNEKITDNIERNEPAEKKILRTTSRNKSENPTKFFKKRLSHEQKVEHEEIKELVNNEEENTESIREFENQVFFISSLKNKAPNELIELANSLTLKNRNHINRHDVVFSILKSYAEKGAKLIGEGVIEILNEGYGFLRSTEASYTPSSDDIYVSPNLIKRFGIRSGDAITGVLRSPRKEEKYFSLINIESINSHLPEKTRHRVHFDDLTPLYPQDRIKLELDTTDKSNLSGRIVDIVSPIGKGQRALVVAPPRTGKTVLMQNIAHSIAENYPEIHLLVLSIGERPEEVTDMLRSVKGEVVSSTFDEPSHRHVQLAELVIEKARRLVEQKKDVVILLDSITRLARAYNDIAPSSGKVLSGGVDSNALQRPKKFFGAARNIEEGGSLSIIATALIETGSRMDEVIFEEFKGTGNAEIILDRKIADKRVFPAIDVTKSGTRKEELLVSKENLSKAWILRKILNPMGVVESVEFLLSKLKYSKTNDEFFAQMNTFNQSK